MIQAKEIDGELWIRASDHHQAIKQALVQPEPVELAKSLALNLDGVIADVEQGDGFDDVCLDTIKFVRDALYTSPPKREWQGLTDDELEELRRSDDLFEDAPMWGLIVRAIEAKLKEKNN